VGILNSYASIGLLYNYFINQYTETMQGRMKVMSFNCKGIKGNSKREKVLTWIKESKSDIIFLQESHFVETDRDDWETKSGGTVISSVGSSKARGVTTILYPKTEIDERNILRDKEGRWLIINKQIEDQTYTLVNYYGPNIDDTSSLQELLTKLEEIQTDNIIFGGDFNFVYDTKLDKIGGNNTTNHKCRNLLVEWQTKHNIIDIWRLRNPRRRQYTWCSNTKPKIRCRLDHILLSQHLTKLVDRTDIEHGFLSDHKSVVVSIKKAKPDRGPGFWKFNTMLLSEEGFSEEIIKCIKDTVDDNPDITARLKWDLIKCNMRRTCIKFGVNRKKTMNNLEIRLKRELTDLENEAIRGNNNQIEEEINNLKSEIDEILVEKCRGTALRSKCLNYEHGEKATMYFLNMERSKGNKQTITQLINDEDLIVEDQSRILEEEIKFFSNLYSKHNVTQDAHLLSEEERLWKTDGKQVDEEEWEELTKEITEEEIWSIIKTSPNNKSPGIDGYTNEFYRHFWQHLKKHLLEAYKESLAEGELCISQRRGVISLLPKDGKDLRYLKNWRPLTLLNNDYKYLAKGIANRCKKLLPLIISLDQNGFVPGRQIGSNIIRSLELIRKCNEDQIPAVMINIDIEKAFDSVDWNFMYKTLNYFNFPAPIINMIKCIYTNLEICTMNNGFSSRFAKVERGMRQGCPLSPILFVIVIEMLNIYLKTKTKLEGISINREHHLISQFADDTSFFLINNPGMIDRLFSYLQTFGKMTGLNLNVGKTEILPIGSTTEEDIPKNYKHLIKTSVKSLGVLIHRDIENTIKENYETAKKKMLNALKFWAKKPLSLMGKINIIKNQVTSKIVYCMNMLPDPGKNYWKEINKALYGFIANNRSEKLRRKILINKKQKGGAQMVDLETQLKALKAMWMTRTITSPGPWCAGLEEILHGLRIDDFTHCNLSMKDIPFDIPKGSIWKEIIECWCEVNYKKNIVDANAIVGESIWLNSNIKLNGKVLWKERWYEHGIHLIDDILDEDRRELLNYEELQDKYHLQLNFIEGVWLKNAVPGAWKNALRNATESPDLTKTPEHLIDKCINSKASSKKLYNLLLESVAEDPGEKLHKWIMDLDLEVEPETVLKAMVKTGNALGYMKLKSFSYNMYLRNLTYGTRLKKMGKDETENCATCGETESILHLYWTCPEKQVIWNNIYEALIPIDRREITPELCLLNIIPKKLKVEEDELTRTINTICSNYIHTKRCKKEKTSLHELYNIFRNIRRIEYMIALEKGKLQRHNAKWGGLRL
jgi:exonuclease III